MLTRRLKQRIGCTAMIAVSALSLSAASANAGLLVSSAPSCDDQALSTPFLPWLDVASYTPLAGGDFERAAAGWTLSGGAKVAAGNEPFQVSGPGDAWSLSLPPGSSARSPTICVGLEHPTLRLFAKRTSGGTLEASTLQVEVLFETALGTVASLPIGVVNPSPSWQPTTPMTVVANLLALLPGERTPVAFRFRPLLGGAWSVDDVYVDPYQRR